MLLCILVGHEKNWAPSQYPKRRLFVRSRKVSKPRDWYFELSYRFEIWQAHRQHCCRSACQISERSDNSKYKSRGFVTLGDLTEIRLFGYWDEALVPCLGIINYLDTKPSKRWWYGSLTHMRVTFSTTDPESSYIMFQSKLCTPVCIVAVNIILYWLILYQSVCLNWCDNIDNIQW